MGVAAVVTQAFTTGGRVDPAEQPGARLHGEQPASPVRGTGRLAQGAVPAHRDLEEDRLARIR